MPPKTCHILREFGNGVQDQKGKFFPFRIASFIASGSIPVKNNVRYYIDRIYHNANNTGALAGGVDKVEGTVLGAVIILHQVTPPTTFAASNEGLVIQNDVGVLFDINTPITVTIASITPFVTVKYAMVDESPGEYCV